MADDKPPLIYRPVFVQCIRRQRCRYNPSLSGYFKLPAPLQAEVTGRWQARHKTLTLPTLVVQLPPAPKHPRKAKAKQST